MKLHIAQIVLEEATFKHREGYLGLPPNRPATSSTVELGLELVKAQNDESKVAVRVRVTDPSANPYAFSVVYVVILTVGWESGEVVPEDFDQRLLVTGSTMVFPFIREVIAGLTGRGRFGPVWLAPTDFNKIVAGTSPPTFAEPGMKAP